MLAPKKTYGASNTDPAQQTMGVLKTLTGSSGRAQQAMDFASQLYPDMPEADPWEAAFQFFAEMGRAASQPGATVLGSAVGSMQVPMDYLNAKKKEKLETDRARMQTAVSLAPSLKPKPKTGSGTSVMVVDPETGKPRYMSSSEAIRTGAQPYIAPKSGQANGLKPFGLIDPDKLAEIQRVVPSAALDADGNVLLTDIEAAKVGIRPYIGQKVTPSKDGAAGAAKYADDGTGVLRYTENPPEGKEIGDIVFSGTDIAGFTTNDRIFAGELRDDLTKSLGDFEDINSSMKDINSFYTLATTTANPISDYSLAVQYAKIIDPGTAAREGEVAAIASAGSLTGAARAQIINAIFGNGKLSPKMRASIFNNSVQIYNSKLPGAISKIKRYKTVSNKQKEGLFSLVGINVDIDDDGNIMYKGVGGDPAVDTNNYHPVDLSTIEEDPTDSNPDELVFPENFSFDGFTRGALVSMLQLPPGVLDATTLDKLEAALAAL